MTFPEYLLGPLTTTAVLIVSTFCLLYWYLTRHFNYWKDRGVPYVKPIPLLGSNLDIFRMEMHEAFIRRYKSLGPIYGIFEGPKPALTVGDPDLLRDILLKDFQTFIGHRPFSTNDVVLDRMLSVLMADDWKRVRSLLSPTFSTGQLKRVYSIFKDCSMTVVKNFNNAAEKGETIDAKRIYGAFTMDIIANSAFSIKIDSHNDPDNDFVRRARHVFSPALRWRFLITFMFPRLMKLFGITMLPKEESEFFKQVVRQVIESRRKSGEVRNDFLQLLMDATKEIEDDKLEAQNKDDDLVSNYGDDSVSHHIFKSFAHKRLNMDELVAQCVGFFMAGYETTASALAFATYLLAVNPDVQDRLRKEVDEALDKAEGEFTYEIVQNLKFLDNVLSESLRLFPPLIGIERLAQADYKLGDTGITVPKGMIVHVPVYAMHRDPKLFPDPERFNPDRFTAEERAKRSQYAFLPFGAGPRNCVAMRFAIIEIKVCLAHVIANFIIKRCPETKVPIEFHQGTGLLQPKDIILKMEPRIKN